MCTSRMGYLGLPVMAALWISSPAMADDTGFYMGANAGRLLSSYHRSDIDKGVSTQFGGADAGFVLGPSSVDKSHVMWTADVGYMLTRNFGIEASYLHLGSLRYQSFSTEPAVGGGDGLSQVSVHVEVKSAGPALAGVAALPMSNFWEVDARVGAYEGKTTTTYLSTVDTDSVNGRLAKTKTSLLLGAGTGVTLTNHLVARLDYLRLQGLNDQLLARNFNVDLLTLGLAFVF